MDERLRSLERAGVDDLRWLTEVVRVGGVRREQVWAAAYLGHAAARAWCFEGAVRPPRWSHGELPAWSPSAAGTTLTERAEQAPDDEAVRTLLRGAAAQAALGRLELPALHGCAIRVLDEQRRLEAPRGPGQGCLLLHWLVSVALSEGRIWHDDLAAVADLLPHARLRPLEARHRPARKLNLPATGRRRALVFDGVGRPVPLFIETNDAFLIVDRHGPLIPDERASPRHSAFKSRASRALDPCIAEGRAWAWRHKGECLDALGMTDGAEQVLSEGIEHHPNDLELREVRAGLRVRSGDPLAAATDYGHAAQREQRPAYRANALGAQARCLLDGGRPGDALAPLEAARALRSDSRTLTLLARARRLLGDTAGARAAAQDALGRAPADEEVQREAKLAGLLS